MSGMIDTELGEICSFQNGRAFKKSEWCEVGLPIIRIANLTSRFADFNHFSGEYDEKIFIQNGDIIFSWSGSLKVEIWDRGNALLNQHLYKVGFTADVQKKWVYYLLLYSISYLSKKMTGATLQHVTKKELVATPVSLPDVTTQNRIIAKLDHSFEAIDQAIANTEKNIENVENLEKSYLNSLFNSTELVTSYELGEIIEFVNGFAFKSSEKVESSNTQLVRMTNLYMNKFNLNRNPVYYPNHFT
jgi:type I restriction enzyme, S subunit